MKDFARAILVQKHLDTGQHLYLVQKEPLNGMPLWCLPGGKPEPHETFEEAAQREVREETGIEMLGDLQEVYQGQFPDYVTDDPGLPWHGRYYLCTEFKGEPQLGLDDRIEEFAWLDLRQILMLPQIPKGLMMPLYKAEMWLGSQ